MNQRIGITCLGLTGALLLFLAASPARAELKRIDLSPAVMMNLADGHAGSFMGGSLSGDFYFSRSIALRTTVGFSKDRYYPSGLDYADANYSFWLSFSPYAEAALAGGTLRPYLGLLGTFSTTSGEPPATPPIIPAFGMDRAPIQRIRTADRARSAYSFGLSLGAKAHVAGPWSFFAEVSRYLYTSISGDAVFYTGNPLTDFTVDLEDNPTYLSFGLSYRLDLAGK